MLVGTAVLVAILVGQQHPATIEQRTSGFCSPAIANVTGNVTITCIGVDPRPLKHLNQQLRKKSLVLEEKIKEADEWARRYHEVDAALKAQGSNNELSQEARESLRSGNLDKAGQILDKLLESQERTVDEVAENHFNRGLLFELEFRQNDAIPHLKKAFQYRPENIQYANEYATLLQELGEYSEVEPIYLRILGKLRAEEEKPAADPWTLGGVLNSLATLYVRTQRFDDAEARYLEALRMYHLAAARRGALYFFNTSNVLNNLGNLYGKVQRWNEAEGRLNEALGIRRQLIKQEPSFLPFQQLLAHTLINLGNVSAQTQHFREAEASLSEALEICERLAERNYGAYEPSLATVLTNLGSLYSTEERFDEAQRNYDKALAILRKFEKRDSAYRSDLATLLNNMGNLSRDMQEPKKAKAYYQQSLDLRRELAASNLSAHQPEVAQSLSNLGNACNDLKEYGDAEASFNEALKILRELVKVNGEAYNSDLARTLHNRGVLYRDMDKMEEAERDFREALQLRRTLAGRNPTAYRSDVAITLSELGVLHLRAGQNAEAAKEFEESLGTYLDLATPNPQPYASYVPLTLNNLIAAMLGQGRGREAYPYAKKAVEIARRIYARDPKAKVFLAYQLLHLAETAKAVDPETVDYCTSVKEALQLAPQLTELTSKMAPKCTTEDGSSPLRR